MTTESPEQDKSNTSSGEPSMPDLVQELERLDTELDGLVTATEIRKFSEFTIRQYSDAFGDLRSAFEATEIDRNSQLRDEVVRVWRSIGEQPSRADMRNVGAVSANTIDHYLGGWEDVCEELRQTHHLSSGSASEPGLQQTPDDGDDDSAEGILETLQSDFETGDNE
ncbi:hypothetical protein [Halosimplex carlsbadense]|uniref:hypothetical protein n=1 Tax=Halosimplex carlsbadense TaxID=171164 RepID=UPI0012693235|nr:hypothetical protein [Halosimplex carlsbadense]